MVIIQRRRSSRRWPLCVLMIMGGIVILQFCFSYFYPTEDSLGTFLQGNHEASQAPHTTKVQQNPPMQSPKPIGTWNHHPLYESTTPEQGWHSTASCIFQKDHDWRYTSCRYENLCWDPSSHSYAVFDPVPAVSLGGINPRWDVGEIQDSSKLRWAPNVIHDTTHRRIVQLDPSVLLIPFHSMAGHNVGHLLWDDLFAIYSLVKAFYGDMPDRPLFLLRQSSPSNETLYATCDIRRNKRMQCKENFDRFLPFFNIPSQTFSSTNRMEINTRVDDSTKTLLVCASTALAGLGYWTDHGNHDHGWDGPKLPHNLGRGRALYEFGQFLMSNANLPAIQEDAPKWITFSLESSRDTSRRLDFANQMQALGDIENVRSFHFRDLSVEQQMDVARTTRIFITVCGGGAMTVTFLPKDTTVIIFYDDTGGLDFASLRSNQQPARLDWDLLNNASHLRVHWLPIHGMNGPASLRLFQALISHEIALMKQIHAT